MRTATGLKVLTLGIFIALPAGMSSARHDTALPADLVELETYILTPLGMEVISYPVPADVAGPTTNNSCRDWAGRVENCYLPASRLSLETTPKHPQLAALLEAHLSGQVGAWKPGAYPADGASINIAVAQYESFEQLWLTHRIELAASIGQCWLGRSADPGAAISAAATQPAETLRVEVFSGTRNAAGYPKKEKF